MTDVETAGPRTISPVIAWPVIYTLCVFIGGWLYDYAGRQEFSPWWLAVAAPVLWWAGADRARAVWLPHFYGPDQARSGANLAALVAVSTAGWLVYSGHVGPERSAALLGLVALVEWVAFAALALRAPRREAEQAARLAVQEGRVVDARWRTILDKAGCGDVLVTGRREHRAGLVLTCEPDPEAKQQPTFDDFAARAKRIAMHAAMDYRRAGEPLPLNSIRPEEGADDAEFLLNVTTRDVFAQSMPYVEDRAPRDICDKIDVGEYEDAARILISVLGVHMKIVGMTGAGKTVVANNLIARITACSNALVWVAATDKLVPLIFPWLRSFFDGRSDVPVLDWCAGKHPDRVLRVLRAAYRLACERNDRLADESSHRATTREPAVFVLLEEASHATEFTDVIETHDGQTVTISDLLAMIGRAGRSARVQIILLTQTALNSAIGDRAPDIIRNITARICLRTQEAHDGFRTLPGLPATVNTTRMPMHTMYVQPSIEEAKAAPGKAAGLDGTAMIDPIAVRQAGWRPAGVEESSDLGEDYATRWAPEWHEELGRAVAKAGLPWRVPGGLVGTLGEDEDGPVDGPVEEEPVRVPDRTGPEGGDVDTVWTDEDERAVRELLGGGEPDRPRPFELPDSTTGIARLRRIAENLGRGGPDRGPVRDPEPVGEPLASVDRWLDATETVGVVHGPDHWYLTETIAEGIGWTGGTHALGLRLARFGLRSGNVPREVDPDRRKGYRVADLREAAVRARFGE